MPNAILIAGLLTLTGAPQRQLVDRIVAVVNDRVITLSQLETAAEPFLAKNNTPEKKERLYKDVLDQLIADDLLEEQIKASDISLSKDQLDRAIEDQILKPNNITQEQLEQAVRSRGMSMGQYREQLKTQLLRQTLVRQKVGAKVVIPESDMRAEYKKRVAGETKEELVTIRHIFFRFGESPDPTERERVLQAAQAARKRVVDGEDFETVAKELSQGPTASAGGGLGELAKKSLLPELAKGIENAKPGTITTPIETGNGVHIVRLESRRMKQPTSFESLKNKIHQELYAVELERQLKAWIDELRAEAVVDVRLNRQTK